MLSALKGALSLLTVIPTGTADGRIASADRIAAWFPAAGMLTGGALYLLVVALSQIPGVDRLHGFIPVVVIIASAVFTRMMHWDAIADIADGLWGGYEPLRRREIASDSMIGAFGVTALILYALVSYVLLMALTEHSLLYTLPMVWTISRFSATSGAWWSTPAKSEGLGVSVSSTPGPLSLFVGTFTLAASVVLLIALSGNPVAAGACSLFTVAVAIALPHLIARPFGGTTGDVLGCSIALIEVIGMTAVMIGALL